MCVKGEKKNSEANSQCQPIKGKNAKSDKEREEPVTARRDGMRSCTGRDWEARSRLMSYSRRVRSSEPKDPSFYLFIYFIHSSFFY